MSRPPAVVHVDLDGGADVYAAHGWRWPGAGDELFASGLRATLDFLDEAGLRATLFVIVRALEDRARLDLVKEAVRRGHSLGSHTISHRWLPALAREEQRREIAESRMRLADLCGVPVEGFRAPGFGVNDAILDLVAEAGYGYDSSRHAASAAEAAPHRLASGLLELPLPLHRPLPLPFHPSYSLVLGNWYFRAGLDRQLRTGAPLVLLLHLTDLAEPLPSHYLPGWRARIFTLSHLSAGTKWTRLRAMLDRVRSEYTVVSSRQLVESVTTEVAGRRT